MGKPTINLNVTNAANNQNKPNNTRLVVIKCITQIQ